MVKSFERWCDVGLEQLSQLPYVRAILAESLRMYPQPPILIRRALNDDVLPTPLGGDPKGYPIGKGADIFISVWNLHRYRTQIRCPTWFSFMSHKRHLKEAKRAHTGATSILLACMLLASMLSAIIAECYVE